MYKIVSNKEIPKRTGRGRPPIYPFRNMQVGDSIFVPTDDVAMVRNAAASYKTRHPGWNYTTRASAGGVDIWRTA